MDPHAVDMWALGIILQHVLTGKEPGLTTTQTSIFDSAEDSLQLNQLEEKKISSEGINFLRRLLSSDPSQRPGPKECLEDPWICEDRNNASRALAMAGLHPEERRRNPENAVKWAIENGNRDVIHLALDHDFDIDAILVDGLTALQYSISTGNFDAVKYFVELGASLDQGTELELTETCLHLAVRSGQPEILKYLVEHDAALEVVSGSGKTALASFESDISRDCIEVLLDHNADTESAPDIFLGSENTLESENVPANSVGNGYTPLHHAASLGLEKITRLLLERGANVRARTKDGETPLHIATDKGYVSVVEVLLEFEAPIEARDNYGNTALAVSNDVALPTVKLLLERNANIGTSNDEGFRPLHHTACNNCPAVADFLLRQNAVVDPKSKWGSTPLHLATASGASEVVRLLLKNKADIEALDEEGFTPLGYFSDSSSSCIDLLLANGADMKAAKNPKKLTPLHVAAQVGNARIVELLLAKARRRSSDFMVEYNEAKMEKKDAKREWKNAKGFNESRKASSRLRRARSKYNESRAECDKLLSEFSDMVNAKSSSSRTPLDYAAEGNWKTVEGILRDNMGHSGTYLGKVVRVAEKSLRKMYENWRSCEQCKTTIFASGWQCEICEPETRNVHDSRRTYDLCNGCVARGYRCPGEGHFMYAKSATAPIDREDVAPVLESPRLALDNRSNPYQASNLSFISQASTVSVNFLPRRNVSGGSPDQRQVHTPSGKSLRIGMETRDSQLKIPTTCSKSPRVVSGLRPPQNRASVSSFKSSTSVATSSSVNSSSIDLEITSSPPYIPASDTDTDPSTDTEKESMHKSPSLQEMKPSIVIEKEKLQSSELDSK